MPKKSWNVGLDVCAATAMVLLVDGKNQIRCRQRTKLRPQDGYHACLERLGGLVDEALDSVSAARKDVAGIGLGVPGVVDAARGMVVESIHLGWKELPVRQILGQRLGIPVAVDNDVNLGTYGEYTQGAARGMRNVLGIFERDGIGGGIIVDGKIYRGQGGAAGEIGHLVVDPSGPRCSCGRSGCLEALAGRSAVAARAALWAQRGMAPHLMKEAGSDVSAITGSVLAASVKAGDVMVQEVVRDAARWIGLACANLANLLVPEVVVFSGSMFSALGDEMMDEVRRTVEKNLLPFVEGRVKLVAGELGEDAVALGAVDLARGLAGGGRAARRGK